MSATTTFAIHPLADLIPRMTEEEYTDLVGDIRVNGQLQPILIYEHQVLDGRHRLRACEELGLAPRIETYEGDEPAAHVLSLNLRRRHLSTSQRAMIATDFLPHLEEEAHNRRAAGLRRGSDPAPAESPSAPFGADGPAEPDRAAGRAGQMVGVSPKSVDRAKRISREAPDLVEPVRTGELTVTAADAIVKQRAGKEPAPENGRFASGRSVQRIANQASALAMALDAIPLNKSCARLTDEERERALAACKQGLKALNALANALGR